MRTALVTGGTRGIGLAISKRLAAEGYAVYATYARDEASAAEAARAGLNVVRADVASEAELSALFASLAKIDLLVNNAGIALYRQLQDTSLEEWNRLFAVNVTGTFLCCRFAAKKMLSLGKGCIVNVASVWGERGGSCEAVYSASKGAVIALTKALAAELGYAGIRVNAVSPGAIETAMNAHLSEEEKRSLCEEIPAGRFGSAEEIADAVLFLVKNEYCNGTILSVNGGM